MQPPRYHEGWLPNAAAHPVSIGGLPFPSPVDPDAAPETSGERGLKPTEQKLLNDTIVWARSLAELPNRKAERAALAVSENAVLMASEAVRDGIVDLEAADLATLLKKIDGRQIAVRSDSNTAHWVRLRTADVPVRPVEMWSGERLLVLISEPNVAVE